MASEDWGEVIQFLDGWCYGIADDGRTVVCCGQEDEAKAMLANPNKKSASPVVNDILDLERRLQNEKEIEHGKAGDITPKSGRSQRVVKTGNVRARPDAHAKHRPFNTRYLKKR